MNYKSLAAAIALSGVVGAGAGYLGSLGSVTPQIIQFPASSLRDGGVPVDGGSPVVYVETTGSGAVVLATSPTINTQLTIGSTAITAAIAAAVAGFILPDTALDLDSECLAARPGAIVSNTAHTVSWLHEGAGDCQWRRINSATVDAGS